MYLFICEKWEPVQSFRNECMKYVCDLFFEATDNTFWGCGLDIKTIEKAKQREDFHAKQILSSLTGYNICWMVGQSCFLTQKQREFNFEHQSIRKSFPRVSEGVGIGEKNSS